ncbi:MAG TPA: PaaI family thioesterase [Burkholderiales bacterium]|nr:PaaI family thioesterase [Burkholderiales bacterium]
MGTLTVEWTDAAALAAAGRSMAGIDFLRAIRDGRLPAPPLARVLGFNLVEVEPGHAVFEITPGEQHYNPIGVVHGGVAMTLLDSAMGCCIHTRMPLGSAYTTLEAKTNLVRAITDKTGRLRAIGTVVHVGTRVATAEGRVEDAAGKLYAHATSTCLVLNGN